MSDSGALAAAGFSPDELAAYELIITRPASTLPELAKAWDRRAPLAAIVADLQARGFVIHDDGAERRYSAVDPDIALDTPLTDYAGQLRRARERVAELAQRYQARSTAGDGATLIEVVTGQRAVQQRITQLQFSARHEVCCLDKPPYLDAPGTAGGERELLGSGVACRTIYERASVEAPGGLHEVEQLLVAGQQARVLPTVPMKLYLVDRRHAVLPLQREPTSVESAVVVHAPALLAALSTLFEGLWERALPMRVPAQPGTGGRRSTVDEHRLVTLLLSGLTDEAIARQLALGYRTVQRHIAALMTRLGAHTRFQAGVRAALNQNENR
jgi:DNA-binding CsgD family transcriptional regulator